MRQIAAIWGVMLLGLLTGLTGCGSESTATKQQQKTATVTFSTVSSAHNAPLEAIQLKIALPPGATVSDIAGDLAGTNDTGAVAMKNYTATPAAASFVVQQVSANPIKFGSFARLTCAVAAGTTLDGSSFTVLPGDILMSGKDANGSTVSLASQIPVTLSVSFGY